jgi:hypothetical protein
LKGIFNEDLNDIYTDIYQFVRVLGFSAEYIEKITPNEREIYKMMYKKEMEERNKKESNNTSGSTIGKGIETV